MGKPQSPHADAKVVTGPRSMPPPPPPRRASGDARSPRPPQAISEVRGIESGEAWLEDDDLMPVDEVGSSARRREETQRIWRPRAS